MGNAQDGLLPEDHHRKRIFETVLEHITALIDSGEIRQGGKLPPERTMAELFGVSRSAVREAIRALQEQGVVHSRQGDGTYVAAPPEGRVVMALARAMAGPRIRLEQVLQFRQNLEPQIAALAAENATSQDLADLEAILSGHDARSESEAAEADLLFHATLARATGNPLFMKIITVVRAGLAETREEPFQSPARLSASQQAHRAILDAVTSRDPEAARKAMEHHLRSVARIIFTTDPSQPLSGTGDEPKESLP